MGFYGARAPACVAISPWPSLQLRGVGREFVDDKRSPREQKTVAPINHLHMAIRPESRRDLGRFLSALCGAITHAVTGARKGKALGFRFFGHIPFTRIVEWGRAFRRVLNYVQLNVDEAAGRVPYRSRCVRARPPS